jgi:glycerophosphoryl diester phosphodiesterase
MDISRKEEKYELDFAMRKIKKVLHLLSYNWKPLFGFEIIYKLLSAAVMGPLLGVAFRAVMELSGHPYLTTENIGVFLKHPLVITGMIFMALLICVFSMFDIGALIFLMDQSYHHRKVSLYQTVVFSLKNALRVAKPGNFWMAVILFLLIPFLNIGVASSFVVAIPIPEFIMSHIKRNEELLALFCLMMAGLAILLLRWIYAFHYFTLRQCGFKEARVCSQRLSRKNKGKDLFVLIGIQMLFYFCYALFAAIAILMVVVLRQIVGQMKVFEMVMLSTVWGTLVVILLIVTALGTPVSYACISVLYYFHIEKSGETLTVVRAPEQPKEKKKQKQIRITEIFLLFAAVCGCALFIYMSSIEKINPQIEYLRTMEVTAHRGASAYYPENTMAAFYGAVEMGADWIELDVQQSRDGRIFVMHDRNFQRTAGVNKNSWEMDWAEIAALDVGSYFGEIFEGEKVPLLSEVLEFAKENNIRLNIELKPSGHEKDFEKGVVDAIQEADYLDSCVITSWNYRALENVKAYCEEATTVYVMGIAIGNVNRLKAADNFSMEASNVTPSMVSRVHNAGKQLYAWTVNTKRSINRMIDLNVDNIITDKVLLAQECIYENKTSDIIQTYVEFLQRK